MTPTILEIDNRSPGHRSEYERFLEERVKALQAEVVRQEHVISEMADRHTSYDSSRVMREVGKP